MPDKSLISIHLHYLFRPTFLVNEAFKCFHTCLTSISAAHAMDQQLWVGTNGSFTAHDHDTIIDHHAMVRVNHRQAFPPRHHYHWLLLSHFRLSVGELNVRHRVTSWKR